MTDVHEKWVEVSVTVQEELADAVANFLTEAGSDGVSEELLEMDLADEETPEPLHIIKAYFPEDSRLLRRLHNLDAYLDSLTHLFPHVPRPQYKKETVIDIEWAEGWKKYFKPLQVAKNIVIKPTWERYTATGRDIVIEMDPGMAFGTGQHASTRMCLQALEDLLLYERAVPGEAVLDVGTGTGILGIAAAKLGAKRVFCVDIDRQAIAIAQENIRINEVMDRVTAEYRDVRTLTGQYDLIVANLTEQVLIRLRPHLIDLLTIGGFLIISGIIDQYCQNIEEHYISPPLDLYRRFTEKEWLSYVFKKTADTV